MNTAIPWLMARVRKQAEHPAVTETRLSIAERKHLREISDGPTPG